MSAREWGAWAAVLTFAVGFVALAMLRDVANTGLPIDTGISVETAADP